MDKFRPSLERVMKDLNGLDYELQMFIYHKMNGREEEAQTYLDTYKYNAEKTKMELEIKPVFKDNVKIVENNMIEYENNIEV